MNVKIGAIIKRLRAEKHITQDTLATAMGVTPQAISRWESEGGYPDIELLPALADFFSVSIDELLGYRSSEREQELASIKQELERLAGTDDINKRLERLLYRRIGIIAVRVEQVHIIEPHPFERLIEAGDQILAATPLSVRTVPHAVTGFGGDKEFIPVRTEIFIHQTSEIGFCATGRNTIVVRKIKMRHAMVKSIPTDSTTAFKRRIVAKIMPESQTDFRQ